MQIEIREDSVVISGYVNAVERYSKPIRENLHGKIRTFIERIKSGVFKKALKNNDDVKVLLNHDEKRQVATTKDGSAKLEEDNIGLRAEVTITDAEVIEKARANKLVGWSFGFYPVEDVMGSENGMDARTITDLDLVEVSILDDEHTPAYYGTSIEARAERQKVIREFMDDELKEPMQEPTKEIDVEQDKEVEVNIDELAELIAVKIMQKFEEMKATDVEEKGCKKKDEPKRDLTSYYERLKNL